ncbi:hypothetical protein IVA95_22780 [Bradyrhizobium sp. 157]|uniref:hypothetical protein n=1 Tax=Bradyrhizobium sp. 157 TaxID=2782631 RepID=UPI001FF98A69|nr:hypothetical protein [Bradyrhizobium sp. 157]MCK1640353.1 hypothetical protein [Bradyrhizobium sp. 157]
MSDKGKTMLEEAVDKVNDVVEDLTLKAADAAIEPTSEHIARHNEQVRLSETSEIPSLPSHIDPSSVERAARERQKYVEQIVAAAANSGQVRDKAEASRLVRSKRKKARR